MRSAPKTSWAHAQEVDGRASFQSYLRPETAAAPRGFTAHLLLEGLRRLNLQHLPAHALLLVAAKHRCEPPKSLKSLKSAPKSVLQLLRGLMLH